MVKSTQGKSLNLRLKKKILPIFAKAEWDYAEIPAVTAKLRLAIISIGAQKIVDGKIPSTKDWALAEIERASDKQIAFALREALY